MNRTELNPNESVFVLQMEDTDETVFGVGDPKSTMLTVSARVVAGSLQLSANFHRAISDFDEIAAAEDCMFLPGMKCICTRVIPNEAWSLALLDAYKAGMDNPLPAWVTAIYLDLCNSALNPTLDPAPRSIH